MDKWSNIVGQFVPQPIAHLAIWFVGASGTFGSPPLSFRSVMGWSSVCMCVGVFLPRVLGPHVICVLVVSSLSLAHGNGQVAVSRKDHLRVGLTGACSIVEKPSVSGVIIYGG